MTRERGPLVPLEQRCVKPGYWLIEGYDVRKIAPGVWSVTDQARASFTVRTLATARERIRERL